jgi:hypothetical protein
LQHKLNLARYRVSKSTRPEALRPRAVEIVDSSTPVDGKTYRVDTSTFFPHDVAEETTVVDSLGQKLSLNIENIRGGGGQRRVSIFCPFWVVNTTEHAFRYRQESSRVFVSGTVVSPDKNGSLLSSEGLKDASQSFYLPGRETGRHIFSGTPGALASKRGQLPAEEVARLLDSSLRLDTLAEIAFMFNFHEGMSIAMSNQRMCLQLGDGTNAYPYESDWSRGFSLDSVGINQVVR